MKKYRQKYAADGAEAHEHLLNVEWKKARNSDFELMKMLILISDSFNPLGNFISLRLVAEFNYFMDRCLNWRQ